MAMSIEENMIQRIDTIMALKDKFDYEEFLTLCQRKDIPPLSIGDYAQRVGMLQVAMLKYGDRKPLQAYLDLVDEMNAAHGQGKMNRAALPESKGCCGGKK
jgi:hypothetical protein